MSSYVWSYMGLKGTVLPGIHNPHAQSQQAGAHYTNGIEFRMAPWWGNYHPISHLREVLHLARPVGPSLPVDGLARPRFDACVSTLSCVCGGQCNTHNGEN
eukprot:1153535-Pelagomonas_calceolata.AAC.6